MDVDFQDDGCRSLAIKETRSPVLQRLKQDFKNDLIAGLLVVIPLATTIWLSTTVAAWVVNFLTRVPKRINPFNDLHPILSNLLNLAIGFAVPLFCILLIGLMARNIAGRWLLDFGERILQAIPFAGSIYKTLKQLLETVFRDSSSKFRRVVLVEYPRRGIWAIAFVTGTVTATVQPDVPARMLSLFIPTTPNPTTGWYAVVPEDEVMNVSLSIEDAFKVLISGGIVGPTAFSPPLADHAEPDIDHTVAQLPQPEQPPLSLERSPDRTGNATLDPRSVVPVEIPSES